MKPANWGKLNSPDLVGETPILQADSQTGRIWGLFYKLRPDLLLSDADFKQIKDDVILSKFLKGTPGKAKVGRPRKEVIFHLSFYEFLRQDAGFRNDERVAEQVAKILPGNDSPTEKLNQKNEIYSAITKWKDQSRKGEFRHLKSIAQVLAKKSKIKLSVEKIEELITPKLPPRSRKKATDKDMEKTTNEAMLHDKRLAIDYMRRWCPAIAAIAIDELCMTETSTAQREVLLLVRNGFPHYTTQLEDWLSAGRKITNFKEEFFSNAWSQLLEELQKPLSQDHPDSLWWYLI